MDCSFESFDACKMELMNSACSSTATTTTGTRGVVVLEKRAGLNNKNDDNGSAGVSEPPKSIEPMTMDRNAGAEAVEKPYRPTRGEVSRCCNNCLCVALILIYKGTSRVCQMIGQGVQTIKETILPIDAAAGHDDDDNEAVRLKEE